jgi:peptide/nickel transport system permease protein
MIPVVIGVTILIFTILYFVPGDPAQTILGSDATQEELNAKRVELGLNDSYIVRLGNYLEDVYFHFDFGKSYISKQSISNELAERFPRTLVLCMASMVVAMLLGIPLGVNAAIRQGSVWDSGSVVLALAGVSMPTFWVAQLLVMLFALNLGLLPAVGYTSVAHYILPCVANAFNGLAMQARQTRSGMLEVVHSDYITTARAKGLSQRKVIFGHALPNALIPVITVAGTTFGKMLGSTVVIESVFSIPGIGSYMIHGINTRDYPVVQACVIFLAIMFSLIMLLVDLLYAAIDPRIKAQYAGKRGKS